MKFEIKSRWSSAVKFACDLSVDWETRSYSDQLGEAVRRAVQSGSNLSYSNLRDSNLRDSDLSGSNLSYSDLRDSDLRDSDLSGSNLRDSNLSGSNLRDSNLRPIRDDLWAVLSSAPAEVSGLRAAIAEGRINGSTYEGTCACLVGTLANVRHCKYDAMPSLAPNSSRPIERFFLSIRKGDTPETSQFSKLVLEWVDEWMATMRAAFAPGRETID